MSVLNTELKEVDVKVLSFNALAELGWNLALDTYQRPYVWSEQKVVQMLNDLYAFIEQLKSEPQKDYYFGSVLLHRNKTEKKLFVIDGQQRLTSLAILFSVVHDKLPDWLQFEFRSPKSFKNIKATQKIIQNTKALITHFDSSLFNQLLFTVTIVEREDLAFTFFDTQNNRGVPLGATDLLKAYHLRAINSGKKIQDETLQSHCAKRWEVVQVSGEKDRLSKGNDFAPELFHYYLWRARHWRGGDVKELESRDELFNAFAKQSLDGDGSGRVKLYPGGSNQWASHLSLLENDEYRLGLSDLHLSQSTANLPFALRHPIHKGAGFFLYAEKYAALLNAVFHDESSPDQEIQLMKKLFNQVVQQLSIYLQRLFKLSVLIYVDRLGTNGLYYFCQWLNYCLGAIRMDKADIRRQTPIKFLRDSNRNLIDVIAFAYEPSEVVDFLRSKDVDKIYSKENGWASFVKNGNGVKGKYSKALANYYHIENLSRLPSIMSSLVGKKQSMDNTYV